MGVRITKTALYITAVIAAMAGLWLTSRYNYLLFHSLAELVSIGVAAAMFSVAWDSRRFSANGYLTLLGIAFLSVACLDLLHTLAYKGVGVFVGYGANLPTQLWIAARGLESMALIVSPIFLVRRVRPWPVLIASLAVTAATLALIFPLNLFPVCYDESGPQPGLTPFKIGAEYVICAILAAAMAILWISRKRFSPRVLAFLICAVGATILSELAFTRYMSVYGDFNMLGHLLKVVSFLLFYKAVVQASLKDPYRGLFRELKQSEEALRESEERYRTTVESIGDAVIAVDREGVITFMNRVAAGLTGWEAGEALGRRLAEVFTIINEDTREPAENPVQRVLSEGNIVGLANHTTLISRSGTEIPIEDSAAPIRSSDGTVQGVVMVFHDVTAKRQAENALRASEEQYRLLFASNPNPMFVFDEETMQFLAVNDAAIHHYGWCREDFLAMTVLDIRPPEDRESAKNVIEAHRGSRETDIGVLRHWRKDGTVMEMEITVSSISFSGRPARLCSMNDVTERRQIENAHLFLLQCGSSGESFFPDLARYLALQFGMDYVCIDRLDGELLSATTAAVFCDGRFEDNVAYTLKDTPCGDVVGKTVCCFPSGVRALFPKDAALQQIGAEGYLGATLWGSQGRPIGLIALISRRPIANPRSMESILTLVSTRAAGEMERLRNEETLRKAYDELEERIRERTLQLSEANESLRREMEERKQAEEQLRQAHKMEAIGTLAGGIAHDFNNILAAIIGFTEMGIDDVPDRPLVEKNLRNVLKSAIRARDLVKQILAFSRKTSHERTPLSLTPVVKETVHLLRASIPATVEIRLHVSASSDTVLASPVEVQQVLMNLATNASLAMQEKGGVVEISLTDIDFDPDSAVPGPDGEPGEYLQLAVQDTGVGMSPEVMKRVFEPFFTTREVGKGTGMGLAVAYGIVKDLRGTISVESEPGAGSTFRVLLPKAKTGSAVETGRASEIPGGSEKILFIDDEPMLVEWGRAALERLGYKVTGLADSLEALKVFSSGPELFDLVVTDQAMPRMAGSALASELRSIRGNVPIILCTGHTEAITPERAGELGIREFLTKPLTRQELAEAVRRVLDSKHDA